MIGIELFSGAGGMSLGAAMAGIEIKMAVEVNKSAAATFKANHPESIIFADDIRNLEEIPFDNEENEEKILFGGPPCQGFSRSNHRTRNKSNDSNWLFEEFARVTVMWQPDWIVLENVEGLLGTEGGFFLNSIIQRFADLGYTISYQVLNAVDFGVPQKRTRLFIIGSRHGIQFEFPVSTNNQKVSVDAAINDLPLLANGNKVDNLPYRGLPNHDYSTSLRGNMTRCVNHGVTSNTSKVIERYNFIPQGGNWQNVPIELMNTYADVSRCHTGIYHRLHPDKPSVVIGNYRKNMLIHPNENRGLSVREAARLQSFPDWFEFKGPLNDQQQQVGNAVPPLLAKVIFEKILEYK